MEQAEQIEQEELIEKAQFMIDLYAPEDEDGDKIKDLAKDLDTLLKKNLTSSQIQEIHFFNAEFVGSDIVPPPFDPLGLACLLEKNTRLNRSVQIRSRNTLGLGWKIIHNPLYEELTEGKTPKKVIEQDKKELKKLLLFPNNDMPFTELNYAVKTDEEATGNGYVEILRDTTGKISNLRHIPAHTMRVRKIPGFVQIRANRKRFFKEFGDDRIIDARSGSEAKKSLALEFRANEVLHFKIFSPRSSFYGIPRWVSAIAAICGNRLSAERNIAFFENDAVGRLAVIVNGGTLDSDSVESIKSFMRRQGKGVQNAHRIMVLQTETKKIVGTRGQQATIQILPLTVGKSDDASFQAYRKMNDEEVRESVGIGLPFFTAEGVNRASASELKRITIEQEFIPDIVSHEFRWNMTVVRKRDIINPWEIPPSIIEFTRPRQVDELERASMLSMLTKTGSVTINEIRDSLQLQPLPKSMKWGDLPLQFAVQFFQTLLTGTAGTDPKVKIPTGNIDPKVPFDVEEIETSKGTAVVSLEGESPMEDLHRKLEEVCGFKIEKDPFEELDREYESAINNESAICK